MGGCDVGWEGMSAWQLCVGGCAMSLEVGTGPVTPSLQGRSGHALVPGPEFLVAACLVWAPDSLQNNTSPHLVWGHAGEPVCG